MSSAADEILDVAIVGAGVAGTYCAWRLLCGDADKRASALKVAIFEGSGRIGGRLLSMKLPGMEHVACDLGGMYFASVQPLVSSVVRALNLATEPLPFPNRNVVYARGARLFAVPSHARYELAPGERGLQPEILLRRAIDKLVPGLTSSRGAAFEQVLQTAIVHGRPLADWGLWNLLSLSLSGEALAYIKDTRPDDFMLNNWNAADTLRSIMFFGRGTTFSVLSEGYDGLPLTLAERFRRAGGDTHLRHRLLRFVRGENGLIELHFARESVGWGPVGAGEPAVVRARSLILAMPRRSLELLDQQSPIFADSKVSRMIASVTTLPMFKALLCYRAPWWRDLGFKSGFALTDLPIRDAFYWAVEGERRGADPSNQNSLMMATLSHGQGADFWRELQGEERLREPYPGTDAWHDYEVPIDGELVREAQRQLVEIHSHPVPEPYAGVCMDWGSDPFGGAGSFWRVHVRSEEIISRMIQPVRGLPVYICGESYSRSQGWVEGSLETSELLLQTHFGLPQPGWISEHKSS